MRKETQDFHTDALSAIGGQVKVPRCRVFEMDALLNAPFDDVRNDVPPRELPSADECGRQEEHGLHTMRAENWECQTVVIEISVVEGDEHTRSVRGVATEKSEHVL